jgi:uncharacterized protein (DUF1015 family)
VPTISPFRALRYDESAAGAPLSALVAPPYDVLSEDARFAYGHRSPYNVVHLTLPDSAGASGEALARWRDSGVLVEDGPALWWIAQEYTGPDGVRRTREGFAGALEATPYSEGKVLPHERTHAGPKEERLAILRATRTQLEPIFLLYDAEPPLSRPEREPDLDVADGTVRTQAWRLPPEEVELDVPLLIADGHHRYETAVAYREEEPAATHTFAVLVSTRDPGVEIFPTHRIVEHAGIPPEGLMTSTWDTTSLTVYQHGNFFRLDGDDPLDTREIEQYELEGVEYTPDAQHAVEAVDDGQAGLAFLVRAPTIAQVLAAAARGETMPQKSTYFYPKLVSGLLLYPVSA